MDLLPRAPMHVLCTPLHSHGGERPVHAGGTTLCVQTHLTPVRVCMLTPLHVRTRAKSSVHAPRYIHGCKNGCAHIRAHAVGACTCSRSQHKRVNAHTNTHLCLNTLRRGGILKCPRPEGSPAGLCSLLGGGHEEVARASRGDPTGGCGRGVHGFPVVVSETGWGDGHSRDKVTTTCETSAEPPRGVPVPSLAHTPPSPFPHILKFPGFTYITANPRPSRLYVRPSGTK